MYKLEIQELSILLVEPSLPQRKIIISKLAESGVKNVEAVSDVPEALAKLQGYKPDLVVSAMYLPSGTGTDLIMAMRLDRRLEAIPFMLVSSETKFEHLDPIRQAGVVAILPKPFGGEELQQALHATLHYIESDDLDLESFDIREVRMLLVDDSAMARKHIRRVLENMGAVRITEAVDGREAIERLQHEEFDLVVSDYNMPHVDGEELLRYIRQKSSQSYLPVIMVTSEQNDATLSSIQRSGVSALCDKPFDTLHVKKLLQQLL